MPRNGAVTRKRRALSADECIALLEAALTHRRYLLFKLELVTGMREGEIIGLTWAMFDWERGAIHLTSQLKWLREAKRWERQTLKNNRDRYVVLDRETLDEFRERHARYLEEQALREEEWNPEGPVFPTTTGTPLNPSNLLRDLRQLTEKAGIGRITFHELRHTAGSLQLAENATMTTVSKNLGHSSVSVTAAVYAHAYADDQRQAVSAVARRLGKGGQKAEEREEEEELCKPVPYPVPSALPSVAGPRKARGPRRSLGSPRPSALQCQNVWSQWRGSNSRPAVYETAALPTELHWRTAQHAQDCSGKAGGCQANRPRSAGEYTAFWCPKRPLVARARAIIQALLWSAAGQCSKPHGGARDRGDARSLSFSYQPRPGSASR